MSTRVALALLFLSPCGCRPAPALALEPPAPTPARGPAPTQPEPRRVEPAPTRPEPAPSEPNPYVAPLVRKGGNLTVEAPPRAPTDTIGARMRTHVEGALSAKSPRVWVGPQVPGFVPLTDGTAELFLLDRTGDEFLAFYRDPYDAGSCSLSGGENCRYVARLYDIHGTELWSLELGDFFSRKDKLEVQDIRFEGGVLYFNEACESYSREAGGRCSALVAVDPRARKVIWRSPPLTSNSRFAIAGEWILAGYGFTAERDFLYVVSKRDGKRASKTPIPAAPESISVDDDGVVRVQVYPGTEKHFRLEGKDGPRPKLVEIGQAGVKPNTRP